MSKYINIVGFRSLVREIKRRLIDKNDTMKMCGMTPLNIKLSQDGVMYIQDFVSGFRYYTQEPVSQLIFGEYRRLREDVLGEAEVIFKAGSNMQIIEPSDIHIYWNGGKPVFKSNTLYKISIVEDFDECLIMEIYEYE